MNSSFPSKSQNSQTLAYNIFIFDNHYTLQQDNDNRNEKNTINQKTQLDQQQREKKACDIKKRVIKERETATNRVQNFQ